MDKVEERIYKCGIIPVIKLDDANDALPLCKALYKGGIDVVEITFRTDAAEEAIKKVSRELPDMLVGAGTILNIENAKKAIGAGGKFIVSPGFNEVVVKYSQDKNVNIIPGISSPTDIEKALSFNLTILKFFPAEANGGIKTLKAMSAPYSMLKFMPTGGINEDNLLDYLNFDKIIACGGSWMVNENLIKNKNFDEITDLTQNAVKKMHNIKLSKIEAKENNIKNNFLDLKLSSKGENTIIYTTTNIERFASYLEKNNISFEIKNNEILLKNYIHGLEIKIINI